MVLDATTGRTTVRTLRRRVLAGLLLILGSWLIGQGLWIPVKAIAAQWLLQQAWNQSLKTQQPAKPWPWADTWPVGRLLVPQHGIDQIILADASGRSLAFGPGQLSESVKPGEPGNIVLSGHRDTHFQFLQHLQQNDLIYLEWPTGHQTSYRVQALTVVDSRQTRLTYHDDVEALILTTCFPFDALLPGGPLRYVVTAYQMTSEGLSAVGIGKAP
ncbi:class GN sortase [uncultured Nitrospira sp.]|uniref:class GN sortase n=1 Tax=uncultured Nitrospira sp. TaxID=157176 RepID=UPI0031406BE7